MVYVDTGMCPVDVVPGKLSALRLTRAATGCGVGPDGPGALPDTAPMGAPALAGEQAGAFPTDTMVGPPCER